MKAVHSLFLPLFIRGARGLHTSGPILGLWNPYNPKSLPLLSITDAHYDTHKVPRLAHIKPDIIVYKDGEYHPTADQEAIIIKEIARTIKMSAICRAEYNLREDRDFFMKSLELAQQEGGHDRECTHKSTEPGSYSPYWHERAEKIFQERKDEYCARYNEELQKGSFNKSRSHIR